MTHPVLTDSLFGLNQQVALVTGASSGLGVDFAKSLAQCGARVVVVARRGDRLQQVVDEITSQGGQALALAADITQPERVQQVLDEVEATWGPVQILVNNAGVAPFGRAEKHTMEDWTKAFEVNVEAVFQLSQAVASRLIQKGLPGRIIQVASIVALRSNPIFPTVAYTASKGAVAAMTRQMATEWAPHGITVNALAPGWFPTEINSDPRTGQMPDKYQQAIHQRTPMGRMGKPGELNSALIFLAAPSSSYVTGVVLPVDGGWAAW